MARYRIRVESIDGSEELDKRYVNGIECDGFAILADRDGDGKAVSAVHRVSAITIAAMMNGSDAFREAHKLMTIVNLMDRLWGGETKREPDEKEEFLKRVIGSLDAD